MISSVSGERCEEVQERLPTILKQNTNNPQFQILLPKCCSCQAEGFQR